MSNKFDKLQKRLNRAALSKEKGVANRYARLYREVNHLIAGRFDKYEKGGKLTYEEMVKYDRLEKLLEDVSDSINKSDAGLRNEIKALLKSQYEESYYQSAFILETGAKAKIGYATIKKEVLDQVINNKFTGLTLNERLSRRRSDLIYSMRETITRGLIEGQTYKGMANIIKGELEGDLVKANRIVRTEAKRVRETGAFESVMHAESKGIIMKKTWNTVKDERVRDRHEELDGVTIPASEKFELDGHEAEAPTMFGVASLDINCRCFLSYEVDDIKKPKHEGLANLTYQEWQKERLK